ncbi:MAG: hemerythrin domain-containing protein [Sideroxyarcus sp.]|nr:hemerythrin domain-containing protein [Sideroxyarcus sp.]
MISLTPQEAAPSFDQPLDMLHACHGKIMRQCDTLQKLAIHLVSQGCDQQARQAAQDILRYFDSAGQFHHQDEEEDVFPALRLAAGAEHAQLHALLDRLLSEHVVMLAAWSALRPALLQIADGVDTPLSAILTAEFIGSYSRHIVVEDRDLLPLAASLLDPQQTAAIGMRMAQRRGAKFPAGV